MLVAAQTVCRPQYFRRAKTHGGNYRVNSQLHDETIAFAEHHSPLDGSRLMCSIGSPLQLVSFTLRQDVHSLDGKSCRTAPDLSLGRQSWSDQRVPLLGPKGLPT